MLIKSKKTMPNHVRNSISVEAKYTDILKKISKVGLLEYIKPMPKSLDITDVSKNCIKKYKKWNEPNLEAKIEQLNLCDFNEKFHGHRTWYGWRVENWGTKWEDYETEFTPYKSGATYTFTTAWAPPSSEIIKQLAQIIPDFDFLWEEEQGYGEHIIYQNRVIAHFHEWEIPEFIDVEGMDNVFELTAPYQYISDVHPAGFYADRNIESYLGESLTEAKATLKEWDALLGFEKD